MGLSSEANYYKNNFNVNLNPPKLFYSNSNQTNNTAHSTLYNRVKKYKLIIIMSSSLFEGIFVDAKGLNSTSLEIVHAENIYITQHFLEVIADIERYRNSMMYRNLLCIAFVNKRSMSSKLVQIFHKSNSKLLCLTVNLINIFFMFRH